MTTVTAADDADLDFHAWPPRPVGGQQTGMVHCGVLVVHRETGIAVVVDRERSRLKNRREAVERLRAMLGRTQPAPTSNATTPIIDLILAELLDLVAAHPSAPEVATDLRVRAQAGKSKYGVYLQARNGRDALRDAYEEACDLVMYLRQAIAEDDEDPRTRRALATAVRLACDLRSMQIGVRP
jgi:hypothetical protein